MGFGIPSWGSDAAIYPSLWSHPICNDTLGIEPEKSIDSEMGHHTSPELYQGLKDYIMRRYFRSWLYPIDLISLGMTWSKYLKWIRDLDLIQRNYFLSWENPEQVRSLRITPFRMQMNWASMGGLKELIVFVQTEILSIHCCFKSRLKSLFL